MAKCDINAGEVISRKKANIKSVFRKTFGDPVINKKAIALDVKRLNDRKKILGKELNYRQANKETKTKEYSRMLLELQEVNDEIKSGLSDFKNADLKNQSLGKIFDLISYRMEKYQHDNLYSDVVDPDIQFPAIKEYLMGQFTIPFNELSDLPALDLKSMANRLEMLFNKADKKAAQEDRGELNAYENTLRDPALVMMESDVSTLAYKVIKKSRQVIDDQNSKAAPFKLRLAEALNKINNAVEEKDLTKTEKSDLKSKMIAQVHEMLDGEEKNLVFKPVLYFDKKGKGRFALKRDERKLYEKILRDQINNKWMDGGKIQKMVIDGRDFYYIAIKQPNSEVYHAYEVPYQKDTDTLLYPMSARSSKQWMEFFSAPGLATTRDNYGNVMKGLSPGDGIYRAKRSEIKRGFNQKGEEISVRSYNNYELKDDQSVPDESVINMVNEARDIFQSMKRDIDERVAEQKGLMRDIASQMAEKEGVSLKKFMTTDKLNEQFRNITGLDSINLNYNLFNGRAISMNQFFNEQIDYAPYRYSVTDMLLGAVRARDEITTKISNKVLRLEALKETGGLEKNAEMLELKDQIEDLSGQQNMLDDTVNIITGRIDKHSTNHSKINTVSQMKAVKSRGLMMEPMPLYKAINPLTKKEEKTFDEFDEVGEKRDMISAGRRKDFNVFNEYIEGAFRDMEQNDLKIELLNATLNTSKSTSNFIIDHVKASMGRLDVNAGLFNWNYSDEKYAKRFTKIYKALPFTGDAEFEITEEMVYRMVKMQSMLISGNLLGTSSALNNRTQRLSAFIDKTYIDLSEVSTFRENNPEAAQQIADQVGVTDTLNAMADALLGAADGGGRWGGISAMKNYTILKLDRQQFINKGKDSAFWKARVANMFQEMDPGKEIDLETMYEGLGAIHDATTGIQNFMKKKGINSLTEAQLKSFTKKLKGMMSEDQINKYIGWKLQGGWMYLAGGEGVKSIVGFQPSEVELRIKVAIQGVLEAEKAGMIPKEWLNQYDTSNDRSIVKRYTHPNALEYSRLLVYNTLFGLSPAYMPKAFRGAMGSFLWKFKPYQWNQLRNEERLFANWNQATKGEKGKALLRLSTKADSELSFSEKKLRRFLLTRGLISVLTTGLFLTPGFNWIANQFRYRVLNRNVSSAITRGGESVMITGLMQLMFTSLALTGLAAPDDDDEEKLYQNTWRYFFPMFVNIIIDTAYDQDPFKPLQIYSKGAYDAFNMTKELVEKSFD